jgi:hypothetical protein
MKDKKHLFPSSFFIPSTPREGWGEKLSYPGALISTIILASRWLDRHEPTRQLIGHIRAMACGRLLLM